MTDFTKVYPANNNPCGSEFNPTMPPNYKGDETYCTPNPFYDADLKRLLAGVMNSIDPMLKQTWLYAKNPLLLELHR